MKSFYIKYVAMTVCIMIISSVIAFLVCNIYYHHALKPDNDQKNTEIAQSITAYIDNHPDVHLEDYLENIAQVGYQLYLVDAQGEDTFFGSSFRETALPGQTKKRVLSGSIYHGIAEFPNQTFVTGFFANELQNTIGVPITHQGESYALFIRPDIKLLFNEMHWLFAWLLLLTITLSVLLVLFSTKYLVKPISRLTKATKKIADGTFDVSLHSKRKDELGELTNSFASMANKLGQMEDVRKEFISNISHDIQSPLANIKGYTNILEDHSLDERDRKEYIDIINGEITRLSSLTKQLLLLASLDRDQDILKKKSFQLDQQLKELIRHYQWLINEKGMMLSYSLPDIVFYGDPSLLHTVWDNLLSNAIKYNKENGSIMMEARETEEAVTIIFEDSGIGISSEEIKRIFDRFYRVDASRTRAIEGSGLGLSIAANVVQLHEGEITVKSTVETGTVFTVQLPKKRHVSET
ncbi:sensor histidine kinase [Gracilibacillus phocaeensis]|uniref:sensor histidine kinase n=1 Tax=Gracilibacillus phocaeensis TaxID=2042304 RepID=UPI00102FF2F1|nr:HAMP domain-containing sensor histidine kinase [Gracilibacillus phocaeensis]